MKNNLTILSNKMTSREIAELTGKEHKNILADIRDESQKLENKGIDHQLIFQLTQYESETPTGGIKILPMYNLTKEGVLQLAARYDAVVRFKLIERVTNNGVPQNFAQALYLAAQQQEEIQNLQLENKIQAQQIAELKPKATYYDLILQNPNLLTTRLIASDYGMTANQFNKMLKEHGVQYKQSGIWFLYREYLGYGYTQTKTQPIVRSDGTPDNVPHMYWTQKGRIFLYEFLKKKGVIPVIEQERKGA